MTKAGEALAWGAPARLERLQYSPAKGRREAAAAVPARPRPLPGGAVARRPSCPSPARLRVMAAGLTSSRWLAPDEASAPQPSPEASCRAGVVTAASVGAAVTGWGASARTAPARRPRAAQAP